MSTVTGTNAADTLFGGAGDDSIVGLGGNDQLQGLGGSDTIIGGAGDDRIDGGEGDDRIDGGDGSADRAEFALRTGTAGTFRHLAGTGADEGKEFVQLVNGSSVETVFSVTRTGDALVVRGLGSASYLGADTVYNCEVLVFSTGTQFLSIHPSTAAYVPVNPTAHFSAVQGAVLVDGNAWSRQVGLVDLNLDGKPELIVSTGLNKAPVWDGVSSLSTPLILLNYSADTGLSRSPLLDQNGRTPIVRAVNDFVVGDFNGDGRPDLLMSDTGPETPVNGFYPLAQMQLLLASPTGPIASNATASSPNVGYATSFAGTGWGFWHQAGAGDINGDGKLDFVTVNLQAQSNGFTAPMFINDGTGAFSFIQRPLNSASSAGQFASTVTLADLNGDGKAEYIWGAQLGADIVRENRVYWNTGSGYAEQNYLVLPFPSAAAFAASGHTRWADISTDRIRTADLNGDGLTDIVISYADYIHEDGFDGFSGTQYWGQVWVQNPDHTFRELNIWENNLLPGITQAIYRRTGSLEIVDINGDGLPDLYEATGAFASLRDIAQITFINMGDGTFRSLESLDPTLLADTAGVELFWYQDMDGDGQAEVLAAIKSTDTQAVLTAFALQTAPMLAVAGRTTQGSIFGDRIAGTGGADSIVAGLGADSVSAGAGDDTVSGGLGNDTIDGGAGASYLRGDDGNDSLTGGSAFDDINGNMGNDTVSTGAGEDYCVGGKGNDLLFGGADYDLVYGNLGDDTCNGDDGNDIVRGGQGNDVVNGGNGDDFVSGDKGNDTMTGGAGADIFHTFGDAGIDRVTDFSLAQGDRVQLDPGTVFTVSQVGADTVINMTGGGQMILVGVTMTSLTGNWIFGA